MREGLIVYIYSKWSEKDMLRLSAINGVADLYELLGIYHSYCHDPAQLNFNEYYLTHVGTRPFHFRNLGEKIVKKNLLLKGIDVPRKDLRLLSRTYKNIPVIASSNIGAIFSELTTQIYRFQVTKEALYHIKKDFSPVKTLYFEYNLVLKYVRVKGYASSFKKRKLFKDVLTEWESNKIFSV